MNNFAQKEFCTIVAGSAVLAANAGFINVVTLAGAFSVTVSHVTGNVSRVALSLYQSDATTFFMVSSILFSFMFGSFAAGYMVGDHKFQLGKSYGYALLLESFMLFVSFATLRKELILGEWCAAFACGLQNGLTTSYSGMVVRTTHMTGIATDIGNILGQACRIDTKPELWRLKVHVPILFGFITGGWIGSTCYSALKDQALLLPCIFTGAIACIYLTLPMVQQATFLIQKAAEKKQKELAGNSRRRTVVEVRVVGDPSLIQSSHSVNMFADVEGHDMDYEIKKFYSEMEEGMESPTKYDGTNKSEKVIVKKTHSIINNNNIQQGESMEEMLVASTSSS